MKLQSWRSPVWSSIPLIPYIPLNLGKLELFVAYEKESLILFIYNILYWNL